MGLSKYVSNLYYATCVNCNDLKCIRYASRMRSKNVLDDM